MKKRLKKLPKFRNEDEERDFWANHSGLDYFDWSNAVKIKFPNLKFSREAQSNDQMILADNEENLITAYGLNKDFVQKDADNIKK
jgi:hypothetical protein